MIRGALLFYCSECGKRFMGMDIEWNATSFSTPLTCPRCGSCHTRPWSLAPAQVANLRYKPIWDQIDNNKSHE